MTRPLTTFVLLACSCLPWSKSHAQSVNGDSLAKAIDSGMILVEQGSYNMWATVDSVRHGFTTG